MKTKFIAASLLTLFVWFGLIFGFVFVTLAPAAALKLSPAVAALAADKANATAYKDQATHLIGGVRLATVANAIPYNLEDPTKIFHGKQVKLAMLPTSMINIVPLPADAAGSWTVDASMSLWGKTGQPTAEDIHQGGIGDCYALSTLEALAIVSPETLKNIIRELPNGGGYIVRVMGRNSYDYTRILPIFGGQQCQLGQNRALWPMVLERWWCQKRTGQNTFLGIWTGNPSELVWALGLPLGGFGFYWGAPSENDLAIYIVDAKAHKQGLMVDTPAMIRPSPDVPWILPSLIGGHSYVLSGYFPPVSPAIYGTLELRNPWGYDGTGNDSDPWDGRVTVTFTQFLANFQEIYSAGGN